MVLIHWFHVILKEVRDLFLCTPLLWGPRTIYVMGIVPRIT